MPSLAEAQQANADFLSSRTPVALFVGGTSGIGRGIAEAFAAATKGNAHIIIAGRDRAAAESIISGFPISTVSDAAHEFMECDASLLKNVHAATASLLSRLPKLNYLVLSCGAINFRGYEGTVEGLEQKIVLAYYARWKFIYDLEPLLKAAVDAREPVSVMSVYAAGSGGPLDLSELEITRENFSGSKLRTVIPVYHDLMIELFSERVPEASFIHVHPGGVKTDPWDSTLHLYNPLQGLVKLFTSPFLKAPEVAGQYMLWALLYSKRGPSRRNETGDDIGNKGYRGSAIARSLVWDHTLEAISRALAV